MKKKNAFTLMELVVVLVILAVIALIVTPLVMNIVKKAGISADKRSVDGYGKSIEMAIAEYLIDTGKNPKSIDDLDIKYTGNEVSCETRLLQKNRTVFLTGCSVQGREVKDDSTNDGYYHYGKLDYKVYNIGDQVTYKGMDFYVIAPSDSNQDYVTLLKDEPLNAFEINTYGAGHVNKYTYYQGTAYEKDGYAGMAYYSSTTCGYVDNSYITDGCTTDYNQSEVKYVVDAWSEGAFEASDLKEDKLGYKARLITYEELTTNLGYAKETGTIAPSSNGETPSWVYNEKYSYWTMSAYEDTIDMGVFVSDSGSLMGYFDVTSYTLDGTVSAVRPVVNINKSVLE